ncbi:MAG: MFS transporter, partial [Streptomycetales bacterium]
LAVGGVEPRAERSAGPAGLRRAPTGRRLLRDRDILLLTLWGCMLVSGQYVLIAFLPVYLHESGRSSLPTAVLFVAIAQVGAIVGRLMWGVLSDQLFSGRRRPLLLAITLVGCAAFVLLGALPVTTPLAVFGLAAFLGGASVIGWQGVFVLSIGELAGPLRAGTATGFSLTFISVGIAAAPPLYGLLADLAGGFQVMWIVLAVEVGMALVPALLVREPSTRVSAAT